MAPTPHPSPTFFGQVRQVRPNGSNKPTGPAGPKRHHLPTELGSAPLTAQRKRATRPNRTDRRRQADDHEPFSLSGRKESPNSQAAGAARGTRGERVAGRVHLVVRQREAADG